MKNEERLSMIQIGRIGMYDEGHFASEARFREHAQDTMDTARKLFVERGGFDMFMILYCSSDPVGLHTDGLGKGLWTICPATRNPTDQFDEDAKNTMMATARAMARRGKAVCVATLAECAIASPRTEAENLLMANGVLKPRHHSNRKDAVWAMLEHRQWYANGLAIVQGPKQLGPWNVSWTQGPMKGRFTDVLQGL